MNELVKNSIHQLEITGYASDGMGVGRVGGCVVFVSRALEGEICRVRILKVGKNAAWGKIEELLKPSPHRIAPACPVYGRCGGCALMHMDYDEELRMKRRRVDDALARIAGTAVRTETILGAAQTERYRNKAIYAVDRINGDAVTGFFRARSHDVISAPDCLIQSESACRAAAAVRHWMDTYHIPAYDEKSGTGAVRHVFCRTAQEPAGLQVTLVSARQDLEHLDALCELIRTSCPETAGIILNVNSARGNTVLGGRMVTLWGQDALEDTLCGIRFRLSPKSFYQVNRAQAQRLYDLALDYAGLTGKETVLDLYCGTGTITLCLARKCALAYGAEIVPEAIADAEKNAERNGISNARFLCADAGAAAAFFRESGVRPDVVVVDPPRKGLASEVIDCVSGMDPARIVYVSCDPATLARDLSRFEAGGYRAVRAAAVDMFPRTAHVETVVLMSRVSK